MAKIELMDFIGMKRSIESGMNRSAGFYSLFARLLGMGFIERSIHQCLVGRKAQKLEVLGPGDGLGLSDAIQNFEEVRLIDLSQKMLEKAREKLEHSDIEYVLGDEGDLSLGGLVFVPFVLNMYSEEGQSALLKRISGLMDQGQKLLILDFNPEQKSSPFQAYLWILYKGFRLITGIPVGKLNNYHLQAMRYFEVLEERNFAKACLSARLYRKVN
ncbi:MAG TPA: hypothetical protein DCS15_07630 [Flavobacteriales bacterium]|jgi:ubiquinone/menaquinone biosynthesis C-methylase UbiE|nr:class I SAM-dependent methyltransferase [Salibacteraceae bacterium]HAS36342.1 hypothetical protein [Flavobacteriales bacterium]